MKIDLYKLADRLAKLALVAIVIRVFFLTSPHWLAEVADTVAATAAVCSLVTMLADEIIERKRREIFKKDGNGV